MLLVRPLFLIDVLYTFHVPEPATLLLLTGGVLGIAAVRPVRARR